jgi:hypothetical protein
VKHSGGRLRAPAAHGERAPARRVVYGALDLTPLILDERGGRGLDAEPACLAMAVHAGRDVTAVDRSGLAHWTDAERWVWAETLADRIADFDVRLGVVLDAAGDAAQWQAANAERGLSERFLLDLLTNGVLVEAIPRHGLRVAGAWIPPDLLLDDVEFDGSLSFDRCRFGGRVSFANATIGRHLLLRRSFVTEDLTLSHLSVGRLSLWRSTVPKAVDLSFAKVAGILGAESVTFGSFNMDGIDVAGDLLLSQGSFAKDVLLNGGHVAGQVQVYGATFGAGFEMDGLSIGQDLQMKEKSTFAGDVQLRGAKVGGQVWTEAATFKAKLDMEGIDVGQDVLLDGKSTFGELNLRGARIGGELNAGTSTCERNLTLVGIVVHQDLFLQDTICKGALSMRGARVDGKLALDRSTFAEDVDMRNLRVEQDLTLGNGTTFEGKVFLRSVKVGGAFIGDGATFKSRVDMDGLEVSRTLFLRTMKFSGTTNILFAKAANIDLKGSEINGELDLTGTYASGELRVGEWDERWTSWGPGARLLLHNTHVGAIQDSWNELHDVWPASENLELDGFHYDSLGGLDGHAANDMAKRPAAWFVAWLARDSTYSPAPYHQLARVLRDSGFAAKANTILFAAREREREQARGWARFGRSLLKVTIGYGLGGGYFRALLWVLLFTAIGAVVLLTSGTEAANRGPLWCTWASFDAMIPLVQLNEAHDKLIGEALSGWRLYYFYLHRIVAYVLGSFVVAGLSGLTQKP